MLRLYKMNIDLYTERLVVLISTIIVLVRSTCAKPEWAKLKLFVPTKKVYVALCAFQVGTIALPLKSACRIYNSRSSAKIDLLKMMNPKTFH